MHTFHLYKKREPKQFSFISIFYHLYYSLNKAHLTLSNRIGIFLILVTRYFSFNNLYNSSFCSYDNFKLETKISSMETANCLLSISFCTATLSISSEMPENVSLPYEVKEICCNIENTDTDSKSSDKSLVYKSFI